MSETMMLKAQVREKTGTRHTNAIRKEGKMPAVVYGHGKDPLSISLDTHEFIEGLHHGHRIFDVELPQGKETLLIKDLQYDYLGKDVIHADFVRVDMSETVTVEIPIEIRGTAIGTQHGGILDEELDSLEIECAVSNIPETIPVLVKDLEVGQSIHAEDISMPEGCTLKTDPKALVLICHEARVHAEEEVPVEGEEAAVEPEVITERAEKEEE